MKSKKILALTLAAIVASGGISQMTTQVYADDECSIIAESMSIVRPSAALKLTKRSDTCSYWHKMLGDAERYVCTENLFASSNNKLLFSINNEFEVRLVRCCDGSENVVIPQRVCIKDQEYNVTAIGECAFANKRKLKSVTLPNSITEIGECAFANCKPLNSIKLSNSITKIGNYAFCNTNINSIEIPASVTILGKGSFEAPTIEKIKIANTSQWNENKKKYVCGKYSNNVNLVEINTQASKKSEIPCLLKVTNINAMKNLIQRDFVFENSENLFYDYKNKLIFEIGENAELVLVAYHGNQENLVVPEKFYIDDQEYNVTSIGERAFDYKQNLKSVELPDSIKEIGDDAFWHCKDLQSIKLPDEVKKIGDGAFCGCERLNLEKLPNNLTEIGMAAFYYCTNLKLTRLPDNVDRIGDGAFSNCTNLQLTKLPNNLTEIGEHTFNSCKKLDLERLPKNITKIDNFAFENCAKLKLTELPDSITEIGDGAFRYCTDLHLTKLPNEVKKIGDDAFKGCESLQLNILPNKVTEIGKGAFSSTNISIIYIPASVTKLGEGSLETSSINVIYKDVKSNLTDNDLACACGTYSNQTTLSTYEEKQTSEQIEESKIDDVTDEITMLTHRKIADRISKDIAEKEDKEAIAGSDNEIKKEPLDEVYRSLASNKKRIPSN